MSEKIFHNPANIGTITLAISQVNKVLPFDFGTYTPLTESKVVVYRGDSIIKTYTVGNGLTLTGNVISLNLNGSDYEPYLDKQLQVECNFLIPGDVEIIFQLIIINSKL